MEERKHTERKREANEEEKWMSWTKWSGQWRHYHWTTSLLWRSQCWVFLHDAFKVASRTSHVERLAVSRVGQPAALFICYNRGSCKTTRCVAYTFTTAYQETFSVHVWLYCSRLHFIHQLHARVIHYSRPGIPLVENWRWNKNGLWLELDLLR